MGFYERRVLPRILNTAGGMKALEPLRRRVCEGLTGDVVEIGFGSGLNMPFYPSAVTRVAAVEPSDLGWQLAGQRLKAASVPVQRSGLDGRRCPSRTTATTPPCPPGRCAPSPTPPPPCGRCGGSSSQGGPCTSWSTGWPPTRMCAAGNDALTHWSNASSADAT
jgi:hypothetical protein